jgi:hypothetical protein
MRSFHNSCNVGIQTYTLAGFEPGIFCSVGGRNDHYATPPEPNAFLSNLMHTFTAENDSPKFGGLLL